MSRRFRALPPQHGGFLTNCPAHCQTGRANHGHDPAHRTADPWQLTTVNGTAMGDAFAQWYAARSGGDSAGGYRWLAAASTAPSASDTCGYSAGVHVRHKSDDLGGQHLLPRAALVLLAAPLTSARNPIVPNVGMADPHAHVFGERIYVYATHDQSPDNAGFGMQNWWQWSSADFVNWRLDSFVFPNASTPGAGWMLPHTGTCWATDAASRNGIYYFCE